MNAGKRLQELAKENGISQSEIARSLGVTAQAISVMASGKSKMSLMFATLVECKYGVRAEWLMTGEGEKYSQKEKAERLKNELLLKVIGIEDNDIIVKTLTYIDSLERTKR